MQGGSMPRGTIVNYNPFEDELRRRMEMARQQGWSDDEINRSVMIERGVRFSNQQQPQQQQAQAPKKGAGRAGGIKGVALDLTPFGRVAEKLINPEAGDISAGEIGVEAALSLIPFGIGKAGKVVKGARGAAGATKNAAQNKGVARSMLRTSTIAPGSTLKTATEQQRLIDLARKTPSLRGSGRRKFQNVEGEVGRLSGNVDDLFKGVDSKVGTNDFVDSINVVRKDIVDPNEAKRFDIEMNRAMQGTFGNKAPKLDGSNARTITVDGKPLQLLNDSRNDTLKHIRMAQDEKGAYKIVMADPITGRPSVINAPQYKGNVDKLFEAAPKFDSKVPASFDKYKKLYDKDVAAGKVTPDAKAKIQGLPGSPKTFADTPDDLFGGPMQQLSATDLNAMRRAVNKQMTGIYRKQDAGTTLTDKDQAFMRIKESLDGQLTNLAPDGVRGAVRQNNLDMNTLMKATPEFKRLAEQRTQPLGLNLPVVSSAIPQMMQAGADYAGRTMTNGLARPIAQQAGVRLGAEALGARNPFKPDEAPAGQQDPNALPPEVAQMFENPQNADEAIMNELLATGEFGDFDSLAGALSQTRDGLANGFAEGGPYEDGSGGQQAGGLEYSSEQLMNMALQAMMAGDVASYKQLSAAAGQVADLEKQMFTQQSASAKASGKGGPNITKVTAQQYGLAQSGFNSLQTLKQMIQQNPGVVTATATPGRKLPNVGGFISNAAGTGEYDAIGYNIADTLLRLRTGATANEGEVRNLQAQLMPRAGDSQQAIARKFQQLEEAFGGVLQTASGPGGGNSFEDEMMAMLTGGQQQAAYGY